MCGHGCRVEAAANTPAPERQRLLEAARKLRGWVAGQSAAAAGGAANARLRLPELVSLRGFLPLAAAGLDCAAPPQPLDQKVRGYSPHSESGTCQVAHARASQAPGC